MTQAIISFFLPLNLCHSLFYAVSVTVLDEETGLPIEDIDIRYNSAVVRSSDDAGEATFTAMNGSYTITAEKIWLA